MYAYLGLAKQDGIWQPTVPDVLSQTKYKAHAMDVESLMGSVVRSGNAGCRTARAAQPIIVSGFHPDGDLEVLSGILKTADTLDFVLLLSG